MAHFAPLVNPFTPHHGMTSHSGPTAELRRGELRRNECAENPAQPGNLHQRSNEVSPGSGRLGEEVRVP